jgi:hypothetical protein
MTCLHGTIDPDQFTQYSGHDAQGDEGFGFDSRRERTFSLSYPVQMGCSSEETFCSLHKVMFFGC